MKPLRIGRGGGGGGDPAELGEDLEGAKRRIRALAGEVQGMTVSKRREREE
jgi:hypothetical protein